MKTRGRDEGCRVDIIVEMSGTIQRLEVGDYIFSGQLCGQR